MNLITKAREDALRKLEQDHDEVIRALYKESEAGKIIQKTVDDLNRLRKTPLKFEELFFDFLLSDEKKQEQEDLNEKLYDDLNQTRERFDEIQAVYNMAENFEQRMSILQHYNILKYGG